ncbi:hypothetical protein [Olsenella uli]|uniref:hypothetical protein n=1 Tax=Olsenella uli TaxID=133926 RepID=UPI00241F3088|nr:hypothetical protein [Olsenella uli]
MKAEIKRESLEELLRILRKHESTGDGDYYGLYLRKCDELLPGLTYDAFSTLEGIIEDLVSWYGPKTPTDKVVAVLELMGVVVTDE